MERNRKNGRHRRSVKWRLRERESDETRRDRDSWTAWISNETSKAKFYFHWVAGIHHHFEIDEVKLNLQSRIKAKMRSLFGMRFCITHFLYLLRQSHFYALFHQNDRRAIAFVPSRECCLFTCLWLAFKMLGFSFYVSIVHMGRYSIPIDRFVLGIYYDTRGQASMHGFPFNPIVCFIPFLFPCADSVVVFSAPVFD